MFFVYGIDDICSLFLIILQLNIEPNHTTLAGHGHEHDVVVASKYDGPYLLTNVLQMCIMYIMCITVTL